MRVVFLGSGAFAIPCFEALLDAGHEVKALVTQPDREKGRGRELAPPPLKPVAERRGVPVLQPRRIREPEAQDAVRALQPEIQVVVAYGQILPQAVIDIPPRGTVNVHSSLLPRYRGAAPIHWAIASCERVTGVTTMLIDAGLDTGPTLLAREMEIAPEDTTASLEPRLARLGAQVLLDTLDGLAAGRLQPIPQDPARATHARVLQKEDGRLDWTQPASLLDCRIRGFFPWPGAFTLHDGRTLKVLRARPLPSAPAADPGTVLEVSAEGLLVACGGGSALRLLEVQPESRRAMPATAFAAGARLVAGARLG
jgi:methionyl-tRNA formyltransferase